VAHAVSRLSLSTEVRVLFQAGPCGICGGQCGTTTKFFYSSAPVSPISMIQPVLHTYFLINARRCVSP
jgi:hypothetical protein